jgi:hypothetical protein
LLRELLLEVLSFTERTTIEPNKQETHKTMKFLSITTLLAAGCLLAGCQSLPPVETETAPDADFSAYRTFAVLKPQANQVSTDPGALMRISGPAQQAVIDNLTASGLIKAEQDQADFSVNLRGESLPKIDIDNWGYSQVAFTRYGRRAVPVYGGTQITSYDERTLIVEMYDNQSKEMVWVGWMTTESNGNITVEQVVEAIHHILKDVPVGTAPTPAN